MKATLTFPFVVFLFFVFGCGLMDKSKDQSNTNVNASTPSPTATATATPPGAPSPEAVTDLGKNFLSFGAGALVASKTSETEESSRFLIDEAEFNGWTTADNQTENQSIVLELPARTTLKTIAFDTRQPTYYDHRAVKDVKVEVSDASATDGFQTIFEGSLKEDIDKQNFPVSQTVAGRFVRYTAKNSFGSPKVIFTKEIRGYGEQEPLAALTNVSGTYAVKGSGNLHLKQEGTTVIGCYDDGTGRIIEGGIEGRVVAFKWQDVSDLKGSGVISLTPDAKKFISVSWLGDKKSYDTLALGDKTGDKIGNCKQMPELDGKADAIKDKLKEGLSKNGRAVAYGINFDFNSDKIKDESKPILEKIVALLKEDASWLMTIEGHTDNIGGESFNKTLSEKRAAAVMNYLTTAGIAATRLNSAGFGLSSPVASNETEAGRAQNRRVELVVRRPALL